MDSTVTGAQRHFGAVQALRQEVENARVYGGFHGRQACREGTKVGNHVAKWALHRFFQPQ